MINWLKKLFTKKSKNRIDDSKKEEKGIKVKSTYFPENKVENYIPPVHLYAADTVVSDKHLVLSDPILDGLTMGVIYDAAKDFINSDVVYTNNTSNEEVHNNIGYSVLQDSTLDTSFNITNSDTNSVVDYSTSSYDFSCTDTTSVSDTSFSSD